MYLRYNSTVENKTIVFNQFTREIDNNKIVKNYLYSRGFSKSFIEENNFGFCPVYSRYSFPLLRGRLIIPIHDVYGELIALAGRQIPEYKDQVINGFWESFGDTPAKCQDRINKWTKGKWINEPYQKNKNLFFLHESKYECARKNYIILVEGYFDAYSLYDSNLKNVAAICGTNMSENQILLAMRYCDNFVILMDSDGPGQNAANNIAKKIEDLGANSLRVFLPPNYDPDEFCKEYDVSFFDDTVYNMISNNKKVLHIRV